MAKQYGGRGKGRNGRGKSTGGQTGKPSKSGTKTTPSTTKKYYEFHPQGDSARQTASFTVIKEYIVDKIQSSYDKGVDIATALTELQMPIFQEPTRKKSSDAFQQDTYDMDYTADQKKYDERCTTFQDNLPKAFAYIQGYCSATMKA